MTNEEFEIACELAAQQLFKELTVLFAERKKDGLTIASHELFTYAAEAAMAVVSSLAEQLPPEQRAFFYPRGYPSVGSRMPFSEYLALKKSE